MQFAWLSWYTFSKYEQIFGKFLGVTFHIYSVVEGVGAGVEIQPSLRVGVGFGE